MKKRVRPVDVEALLREIARYRAQLDGVGKPIRPPKRPGRGKPPRQIP